MYTQSQRASDARELSLFTCTTTMYTTTSQHRCKFMKITKGFSPQCRVESASTIEFGIDPQIRDERVKDGGKEHRLAARVRHCLPCLCAAPGLYILSSIYLHSSYNVSMTTRKWLAFQNEEGSNACALPCGIGGFGWGVGQVGDDGKWPVPRPTRMPTLHLPGGSKFDPPGSTRH